MEFTVYVTHPIHGMKQAIKVHASWSMPQFLQSCYDAGFTMALIPEVCFAFAGRWIETGPAFQLQDFGIRSESTIHISYRIPGRPLGFSGIGMTLSRYGSVMDGSVNYLQTQIAELTTDMKAALVAKNPREDAKLFALEGPDARSVARCYLKFFVMWDPWYNKNCKNLTWSVLKRIQDLSGLSSKLMVELLDNRNLPSWLRSSPDLFKVPFQTNDDVFGTVLNRGLFT